jgi:Di-haem oxidoreductase, putative peroxidase
MKVRAIRPWDLSRFIRTTAGHRQRVSSRGSALFKLVLFCFIAMVCATTLVVNASSQSRRIGDERAIPRHLQDGEEFQLTTNQLIAFGRQLFTAMWTTEDGAGRPLSKGTGAPLSDPQSPLIFPRNFNRVSGPDTNSCAGCHNKPDVGGGGDIVSNVFVLGQRFDFATFDQADNIPLRGTLDERGVPATLQTMSNSRKTVGMYGSGFIEMLARQMTSDLQAIRNAIAPGQSAQLTTKGISFGVLSRRADGTWDTSKVEGLPLSSVALRDAATPPTLIVCALHQAGNVISLRQFTNNAYNHHHGMQAEERFGIGIDADGDGIADELTRADITAATVFQATLPAPVQVIPNNPVLKQAVANGQQKFAQAGCTGCHIPALPLTNKGWIYTEPSPFNPPGNLRPGDAPTLSIDLTSDQLPGPRLKPDKNGVVWVPAFTDLKIHDISSGPNDPNREPLDQNAPAGSPAFFAGNGKFITRKLWGFANQHPFGHSGVFTTIREAVLVHAGEALASRQAFQSLSQHDQDCIIEFLKSLQIAPDGTRDGRGERDSIAMQNH